MGLEFLYQVDNDQIKRIQSFEAIKLDLEKKKFPNQKRIFGQPCFLIPLG